MQNKDIKRGDRVRFLNETGGGVVTRVDKNVVYVEDEIGFEVPVPFQEVVVIERAEVPEVGSEREAAQGPEDSGEPADRGNFPQKEMEAIDDLIDPSQDDTDPRLYLAFTNPKSVSGEGLLPLHLINDSNYFCFYLITQTGEDGLASALHSGGILPNTKEKLGEREVKELDVNWHVQLILFRKDKSFRLFSPVNELIRIKARRFFKENSFTENDFFHEKAVLLPLLKNELESKVEALSRSEAIKVLKDKGDVIVKVDHSKPKQRPEVIEVDLHIHQLLDDTRGLSNADMLKIQTDRVKQVMDENVSHKGQKIVFIHGIGNGTLKHEVRRLLNARYKQHTFQDASFREYGYGATMVII